MTERFRMSRQTLDLLLFAARFPVDGQPRPEIALGHTVTFRGAPIDLDPSLPCGNFYRVRAS